MQVNGSSQCSRTLSHFTWLFESGMFFSLRLVVGKINIISFLKEPLCCWKFLDNCVFFEQGVKIVFKVGLALLKYCHDELVSI